MLAIFYIYVPLADPENSVDLGMLVKEQLKGGGLKEGLGEGMGC